METFLPLFIGIVLAYLLRNVAKSGWAALALQAIPAGFILAMSTCQFG
ncbi:MAG: hypothetical protein ACYC7E_02830 [Armatimonadota bacterium]